MSQSAFRQFPFERPIMSDAAPLSPPPVPPAYDKDDSQKPIYLVSYPKIVFLYPTFIAAIIAGLVTLCFGTVWVPEVLAPAAQTEVVADDGKSEVVAPASRPEVIRPAGSMANRVGEVTTMIFLCLFALNLVVLTFDFPRTTSLTLFFFLAMVAMGLFLIIHFNPFLLGVVGDAMAAVTPFANASFYFMFAGILFTAFLLVLSAARFDYWEVRPNELLHRHGFLSDLKRHPSPNIRIDKEINDVFEYFLLGSGRFIIHPSNEPRAIVLDNVLFIDKKERQITKLLGALQVHISSERGEP